MNREPTIKSIAKDDRYEYRKSLYKEVEPCCMDGCCKVAEHPGRVCSNHWQKLKRSLIEAGRYDKERRTLIGTTVAELKPFFMAVPGATEAAFDAFVEARRELWNLGPAWADALALETDLWAALKDRPALPGFLATARGSGHWDARMEGIVHWWHDTVTGVKLSRAYPDWVLERPDDGKARGPACDHAGRVLPRRRHWDAASEAEHALGY